MFSASIFAGKLITFFFAGRAVFLRRDLYLYQVCAECFPKSVEEDGHSMGVACGLSAVTFFITKNFEFNCFVVFWNNPSAGGQLAAAFGVKAGAFEDCSAFRIDYKHPFGRRVFQCRARISAFAGLKYALPQSLYSGNFL